MVDGQGHSPIKLYIFHYLMILSELLRTTPPYPIGLVKEEHKYILI